MRRLILLAVLAAVSGSAATALAADRDRDRDRERRERVALEKRWTMDKIDHALDLLRAIEEKNETNTKSVRRTMRGQIDDLRKDLRELRDTVDSAPEAHGDRDHDRDHDHDVPPPPPPPPPRGPISMAPGDFNALIASIDRANFPNEKLDVIRIAARDNFFTSEQVVSVLEHMTFSSDRVDAAVAMYPHVVDHENWFKVYNSLEFQPDRDRLKQRTGN